MGRWEEKSPAKESISNHMQQCEGAANLASASIGCEQFVSGDIISRGLVYASSTAP